MMLFRWLQERRPWLARHALHEAADAALDATERIAGGTRRGWARAARRWLSGRPPTTP